MNYRVISGIGLLLSCFFARGQERKIDQLEMLYDQGHYTRVLKKSTKLLRNAAFDYSGLPAYYRSLSLFRLAEDPQWHARHQDACKEAVKSYRAFAAHRLYSDYVLAHYSEITALGAQLDKLTSLLKARGKPADAEVVEHFAEHFLTSIQNPSHSVQSTALPENSIEREQAGRRSTSESEVTHREQMIACAKSLIGTPYQWAGKDEQGFDCSGFTSYVYKKVGISLPRTSAQQMETAQKVKIQHVQKGDLIFFGTGNRATHVGIVVSEKGTPPVMIHASSSKGVIVTPVEESDYWKSRLKGAGTYFD